MIVATLLRAALVVALPGCHLVFPHGGTPSRGDADAARADAPGHDAPGDRARADAPEADALADRQPGLDAAKLDLKPQTDLKSLDLKLKTDLKSLDLKLKIDLKSPDLKSPDLKPKTDLKSPDLKSPDVSTGPVPGTWVKVSGGTFTMGAASGTPCWVANEAAHTVTLTRGFWIQTTKVTQAQFQSVMGYQSSLAYLCTPDCPVENVSWHEAAAYCNQLSTREGRGLCYSCSGLGQSVSCTPTSATIYTCAGYRLPTEAEWERAYRGSTTAGFYTGQEPTYSGNCTLPDPTSDAIGWYCGNSQNKVHPVTSKPPNPLGLYGMAGNVYAWVHDWYGPSTLTATTDPTGLASGVARVTRGGAFGDVQRYMCANARLSMVPTARSGSVGFRCVRTD
jgi:formylglycine-generating enzyme required for sulfatase activity